MNPLGNGNFGKGNGLSPQFHNSIQQVKGLMQMSQGNFMALAQQNPMIRQIMQMCNGQDPKAFFYENCKLMGVDPETILNELRV